jgi:hypothetical protein
MRQGGRYAVNGQVDIHEKARQTALHEAGHVVSAVMLGLTVHFSILKVEINAVGGYTELHFGQAQDNSVAARERVLREATTPEMLRKRTIQVLAGEIAERALNRDEGDREVAAAGDMRAAERFAMLATDASSYDEERVDRLVSDYIRECEKAAGELLFSAVSAVNDLARELYEHPNQPVSGECLTAIIHEAERAAATEQNG